MLRFAGPALGLDVPPPTIPRRSPHMSRRIRFLQLALGVGCSIGLALPLAAEVFVVRPPIQSMLPIQAILNGKGVGETFCKVDRCVVSVRSAAERGTLRALEATQTVTLEALPDARKVFFRNAVLDGEAGTFDRSFPGDHEFPASTPNGLFAVIYKTSPESAWIESLKDRALTAVHPLSTMS